MWKNTIFFHVCCYGFCKGWKSLSNTVVYMMKSNFYLYIVNKWSHKAEWNQGLVSLVFSEIAEIVRVAARHGLFLEFSKKIAWYWLLILLGPCDYINLYNCMHCYIYLSKTRVIMKPNRFRELAEDQGGDCPKDSASLSWINMPRFGCSRRL